jgi:MFS family permease
VSGRRSALRIGLAGAAVLLTAADTYVVVLALPAMIADVGIGVDQLQRATPIISGFLLGYVAVMPMIGRLSDVYGRRPVLVACLAVFACGSLVTASAASLGAVVAGRALQGLGGGGLVPVTLALVADMWPPERRGLPLGAVGAAQELGSVVGPLYGAALLTIGGWRTIFWLNLGVAAAVASLLAALRDKPAADRPGAHHVDLIGAALVALTALSTALVIAAPGPLVDSDVLGTLYTPLAGVGWMTPLTATALVGLCAFALREASAPAHVRALVRPGALRVLAQRADWPGALCLAAALATVVVSFSDTDPAREPVSASAAWLLPCGAAVAVLFLVRERSAPDPLVDLRAFANRRALGALATNVATGAALMTALVDVPILARATVSRDSQLGAAAVLLRLLAAVPVGALLGGWLSRRLGNRAVAAAGLAAVTAMLAVMTSWTATTLGDRFGAGWLHPSDPVLVAAGLGFGLVIAPVNASMLSAVRAAFHGVASALIVVARMIGMLVGISVLTAVGLHSFYTTERRLPPPQSLCPRTPLACPRYDALVTAAIVDELRTVFLGAAVCAALALVVAGITLHGRDSGSPLLVS